MKKLILYKKAKGVEFNSSDERKVSEETESQQGPPHVFVFVVSHAKCLAKGVKKVPKSEL